VDAYSEFTVNVVRNLPEHSTNEKKIIYGSGSAAIKPERSLLKMVNKDPFTDETFQSLF